MSMLDKLRRLIRGSEPTLVDYEGYAQAYEATGTDGMGTANPDASATAPASGVLRRVGPDVLPASGSGTYKIQQSYDALVETVRELREALDGQQKRQEELLSRLSTLPHAVEALPQTSKMQSDMLKVINDRLSMHAEQQRKITEVVNSLGGNKQEHAEALQSIREQIEMGNEIDRQLVESFNRFSMMIDRLHVANNHAVEALQQVRDSYAQTAMQMQEWVEKSRQRNHWILGGAFLMSAISLLIVLILVYVLFQPR